MKQKTQIFFCVFGLACVGFPTSLKDTKTNRMVFSPEVITSGMTWGHAVHTFLSMRHVLLRPDTHLPNEAEKRKRFLLASPKKKI